MASKGDKTVIGSLPDRFVGFRNHGIGGVGARRDGHRVVPDHDARATQQLLPQDLQTLVQRRHDEDRDARTQHTCRQGARSIHQTTHNRRKKGNGRTRHQKDKGVWRFQVPSEIATQPEVPLART